MRAVVLGGVAWNTMIFVDRFPEPAPHTVFPMRTHQAVGSSGAGKALNLASLGADVALWALVGDDEPGDRIRSALADAGITFVGERDPAGTARHVNLMDPKGDRISIFENAGSLELDVDTAPVVDLLAGADVATVTILDHCRAFLPLIEDAGVDTWVDIHDYDGVNPYHAPFIEAADHLFVSTVSLDGWRAFAEDRIASGCKAVICTHGADGASGITATEGWVDLAAPSVPDIVDTNGAGDAFFAGYAVATLDGLGLEASMEAGVEQAALAIASPDLAPKR